MPAHRARRDDGLALVFVSLTLVVLLAFAAMAVDLGATYNERRQDQNAADTGALAGAVELSFLNPSAQVITDTVIDHVEDTIGRDLTDTQWVDDCPAEEPIAGFTRISNTVLGLGSATPATDCISISGDELRVRVPSQSVEMQFAVVIGIDQLSTSAAAQATITFPGQTQPPPFVVPPHVGSGQQICLRSTGTSTLWDNVPNLPYDANGDGDATNDLDPCNNAITNQGTGRFGTIAPSSYSLIPCDGGNDVIEYSIASGMDHTPSHFPASNQYIPAAHAPPNTAHPLERQDAAQCNAVAAPLFPNTVRTDAGIANTLLTCGLVGNTGGGCTARGPNYAGDVHVARLRRGSYVPQTGYTFGGRPIDSKPLWQFLIPNFSAPAECDPSRYGSGAAEFQANIQDLLTCLRAGGWAPGDGPIFSDDLTQSGRFTFLPQIAEDSVDGAAAPNCRFGGGTCVHFNAFVPAFFSRLYAEVTGNSQRGACDNDMAGPGNRVAVQEIGDGANDCGQSDEIVERVSGIIFHCEMLSTELCSKKPPVTPNDPGGTPAFEIRLSK